MEYNHYLRTWRENLSLPVIPVPAELNPFYGRKVEIAVAYAGDFPYGNIKFLTVLGLLDCAKEQGKLKEFHTLIEATSGNTGAVLASLAKDPHYGIARVKVVTNTDLPEGKKYPLNFPGAAIMHPEKTLRREDELSTIATARKDGGGGWKPQGWSHHDGVLNLDQYANPGEPRYHEEWTGVQILDGLDEIPTVLVAGVGTGGNHSRRVSNCFRRELTTKVTTVGVLCAPGFEIPGVREEKKMAEVTLPWRDTCDYLVSVETRISYLTSLWFGWVLGLPVGPSSGFAYAGALKFLQRYDELEKLDELRGADDMVRVVVIFPDSNRPYGDRYKANLPEEYLWETTAPKPWKLLW